MNKYTAEEKTYMIKFGEHLGAFRKIKMLSQEEFSLTVKIPLLEYARIEAGEVDCDYVTVIRIAVAFQVEPKELMPKMRNEKGWERQLTPALLLLVSLW